MSDTLIYMPTNNCARVMSFVLLNELEDQVVVKSPKDYGGMRSGQYRAINPMGKMPAMVTGEGTMLFESQVILEHLTDKHASRLKEPLQPATLTARTKARLLVRVHDIYVSSPNCAQEGFFSTQGAMYKKDMVMEERQARIKDLALQLDVLEGLLDGAGPWAAGETLSQADIVLHPTYIFIAELGPIALGWADPWAQRPKTAAWFARCEAHPVLSKVGADVHGFCSKVLTGNAEAIAASLKAAL